MANDYVVAGRRPLPAAGTRTRAPLSIELETDDEDGVDVSETPLADLTRGQLKTLRSRVGFAPQSVVRLSPSWVASLAVATELALAVQGAVYGETEDAVVFDARDEARPAASPRELEKRLRAVFAEAAARVAAQEEAAAASVQARFDEVRDEPATDAANDWSEVLD